jgi:hypothetical protein
MRASLAFLRHDVAGGAAGREAGPVGAGQHPPCAAVQPPLREWREEPRRDSIR